MKKKEKSQPTTPLPQPEKDLQAQSEEEMADLISRLHIPLGVALNDVYLDTQDMAEQLRICKRGLNNLRKKGQISSTQLVPNGKVFFLKQEVAAILKQNIVIGKNSPLRKNGLKCISTLIGLFSFCFVDAAEMVTMLMYA